MGLLKSRDRAREQARLAREERRGLQQDRRCADLRRREESAGDNPWRQPTVGGLLRKLAERRRARKAAQDR